MTNLHRYYKNRKDDINSSIMELACDLAAARLMNEMCIRDRRKPAAKFSAGWHSIIGCTNTSPRTARSADGSSHASPSPPKRSGIGSRSYIATGRYSCGSSLRTYIRSMWRVTSICAERGTEFFSNHLPPADVYKRQILTPALNDYLRATESCRRQVAQR